MKTKNLESRAEEISNTYLLPAEEKEYKIPRASLAKCIIAASIPTAAAGAILLYEMFPQTTAEVIQYFLR